MADNNNTPKQETAKKDSPKLFPFNQVRPETRERFLSVFPKADDNALNAMLDAIQNAGGSSDAELQKQLETAKTTEARLQAELKEAKASVTANVQKVSELEKQIKSLQEAAASAASTDNNLQTELEKLQKQLQAAEEAKAATETSLAEANSKAEKMKADMLAMNQQTGTDGATIKELEAQLKTLKDQVGAAEEQKKQDRKVIDGLTNVKNENAKTIGVLKAELKKVKEDYMQLEHRTSVGSENTYPEGDILHFFPEITAKLLEETASRMTDIRKDGLTITPQMILADMFNRYTIDRYNLWFYKWVLSDKDIIDIASSVNEKLTDKKILRAALGIRD